MSPTMLALILLVTGVALVIMEVFLPSGGILGFLSAVFIVGSVIYAFVKCGLGTGTVFLAATVLIVPIVISMAIRVWPYTPMGRMILLDSAIDTEQDELEREARNALVGRRGIARSQLLPGGVVDIDGKQLHVVIVGRAAEKGDLVEVIEVQGNRILVTRVDESEEPELAQSQSEEGPSLTSLNDEIFEDDPFA